MASRLVSGLVGLVAGVLVATAPAGPSAARDGSSGSSVESPGHVMFNDPLGPERRQYALIRHIDTKIDRAHRGATVRLAAYSFAMPSTSRALVRAYRRGVVVKVVVDGHSARWRSVKRLRTVLGTNTERRSFVRVCDRSCRGTGGSQHAKFVTISSTGHAERLVMVGSMNFTEHAARAQWQDLYSVDGDTRVYRQLVRVFRGMVLDREQPGLRLRGAGHGFRTEVSPLPSYDGHNDPVQRRLARVSCKGATGGTGFRGRTVLRVAMHGWNGDRGVSLARSVAALKRKGCNVRVLAGVGVGPRVRGILERAHVGVRVTGGPGRATHQKLMFVSGHFAGATDASFVWTGSHNWSDRSLRNDEVTLRIAGARQVAAYQRRFVRIWTLTPAAR
jgi:phosphatidylserine/phosphatidylglycerophosphate/cardiolipin synthase-like enzyme